MSPALLLPFTVLAAAPSISSTAPDPFAQGAVAEIVGADFVDGATSVAIGEVAQQVVHVEVDDVRIVVGADTPLGAQTLVVTTPSGSASTTVTVAPPAPRITRVTPDPVVLGELATIQGEALAAIDEVTVGGVEAVVTEQTEALLVFEVPFDAALLGEQDLQVTSASGVAIRSVTVSPPIPTIDAISPNPARQGDLVEVRGRIVPVNVALTIGQASATVLEVENDRVLAWVGTDVGVGPHDVVVKVGTLTSTPEGPLYVEAADGALPRVEGVYPSNVSAGGTFWVVGSNLAGVTGATRGLTVVACQKAMCQLGTASAEVGTPLHAALTAPGGAAPFTVQVVDEALAAPVITGTSPSPAFRGQTLTITGQNLGTVRTVAIGGRTQSVTFFSGTQIDITVGATTPLGSETLFVAASSGSEPVAVTVLDPFPTEDTGGEADVAGGDTGGGGDVVAGDDTASGTKGGSDGGCATGGAGPGALGAWLAACAAIALARRRRGRPARGRRAAV
ncbi:MAG: IPT/TIG domain-containing protein [Deltaproteobacteria bacterium]|nr:IPT/TIG domain-containing protein [Deltaproteobacteria bacterium]